MKRLTYEFVKRQFEKEEYELLSWEYKNCLQKLDYICFKGHKGSISWQNWQANHRCPYCAGNAKPTIEFIRSEFEKENYELLSVEYINAHMKLKCKCSKGHEYSISWHNWHQGKRCCYCSSRPPIDIESIRSEFAKERYILLTDKYVNNNQKLEYICPSGHGHSISWSNWQQSKRCSECTSRISKGEIQVRNFIKSLDIKISSNDRNQIFNPKTNYNLELDIFMPELNRAIEYNGEYWHKDKSKDLLKQELCKLKMIDLLTIWDNEWKTQNNICKNKIKEFIFK